MSENSANQPLNEFKIGLLGKIFFATLGAAVIGKMVKTKIKGTDEQIRAVSAAVTSSRRFQDELRRPGATVNSVMEKLGVKNMSAAEFERVLGVPWPL